MNITPVAWQKDATYSNAPTQDGRHKINLLKLDLPQHTLQLPTSAVTSAIRNNQQHTKAYAMLEVSDNLF